MMTQKFIPFQYQYFSHSNCFYVIGKGRVSVQDFLNYHQELQINPTQPHLLILSEYRELDPSDLTTSDIEQIRISALKKIENQYESVKEAAVVSKSLNYGLPRMFDRITYSDKYEMNVFIDMSEAN